MDGFILFLISNLSLVIISIIILIVFLKHYLNINIISFGFFSVGFKYVSRQLNPLIESINIKNIKISYRRVKYCKSKVLIINIKGIRLKISPTFVNTISKIEESKFLKDLNKKIIQGINTYNSQKENNNNNSNNNNNNNENKKFENVPSIHIEEDKENVNNIKINRDYKSTNSLYVNKNYYGSNNNLNNRKNNFLNFEDGNPKIYNSNSVYTIPLKKSFSNSRGNLNKDKKKDLNLSSTTLYSVKTVKKGGFLKNLIYMLDNKYIFEIIIPTLLSKLSINLLDMEVEVGFPEGSKVIFQQDYISFSTEKKELLTETKNKYFDYMMFKSYEPFNSKMRLLFSEFSIKYYEANHSFSSLTPFLEKTNNKKKNKKYDSSKPEYTEYEILKSDEKNSIIISSILNSRDVKTTFNISIQDIKCNLDGIVNLIRLYSILKGIFDNYSKFNETESKSKDKNPKISSLNEKNEENFINKYKNMFSKNKNVRYFKNTIKKSSQSKKNKNRSIKYNNNTLHKNFASDMNFLSSNDPLIDDSNNNLFDNSNLNGFMNNEAVQIFLFFIKNTHVIFNFEILNFQMLSTSHFCGSNIGSNYDISKSSLNNKKYSYNQKPQFLNVITIGEISLKGEASKTKSKLYNINASASLKNLYVDIIDYNSKYMIQFLNIQNIFTKIEIIVQFYKYKHHLSYMKNLNFNFNISTINLTSDFEFALGLYQHLNYIIKNVDNKHKFKDIEDPLYVINKLYIYSKSLSSQNYSSYNISESHNSISNIDQYNSNRNLESKNSANDTIKAISKLNSKVYKLKIKLNIEIKNITFNYIILSERIQEYYSVNNSNLSLPNECILVKFGVKGISLDFCNFKKVKIQSAVSSSISLNNDKNYSLFTNSRDNNESYSIYEEQPGLHEIELEINDIVASALFVNENDIIDQKVIIINDSFDDKYQNIYLDNISTKIIFSILSFEKNSKKDDKLLIGTSFGNLKFNFGSSKLASNILIIISDLIRDRIEQFSELTLIQKELYESFESIDDSNANLVYPYSNLKSNVNPYYSTPELYIKNKALNLSNLAISVNSVYSNYSDNPGDSNNSLTLKSSKKKESILSSYILIFDLKFNSISCSMLNPEDDCGFQFDFKNILFHYNNNCYISSSDEFGKKNIIKPNNKIKNQFTFGIDEINIFYLDTIKYMKKGIVVHHFLKINDISVRLVDINSPSLSNINEFGSLTSIPNTETLLSLNKLCNENCDYNKINVNLKKIKIFYSLDVFFSILSTVNFMINRIINPFTLSLNKSRSSSINSIEDNETNENYLSPSVDNINYNNSYENVNDSVSEIPKENILNHIKLSIENIQLELDLPDNMKLFIYLKENSVTYINNIKYDVKKILILLPSQINKKSNLLKIKDLSLVFNPNSKNYDENNDGNERNSNSIIDISNNNINNSPPDESLALKVNGESCIISIPYLFELADVMDSIIHMMKAMKTIVYTVNNEEYINTPTIIEPEEMIKALIKFNLISLQFIENEFESNLSKIYLYGSKEQKQRIAREMAFEKKIADLRNLKMQEMKANAKKIPPKSVNIANPVNETATIINENNEGPDQQQNNENNINESKVNPMNTNSNIPNDNIDNNSNDGSNESINENDATDVNNSISNTNLENEPETHITSTDSNMDGNQNNNYNNNDNNKNQFNPLSQQSPNIVKSQATVYTINTISSVNPPTAAEDESNIENKILKTSLLLKKINSSQWISIVKKYKEGNSSTSSPLMGSISFKNVEALIDKPELLGKTSEESIHIIDEQTPADKIYDTLVPIKVILKTRSASMTLRDFPEKMFDIPEPTNINKPSLIFIVSVFVAEQDPNEECKRWVEIKYFHNRRSEKVLRTINPIKMFYNAKCVIQPDKKANFVWGYSIDPVFTHILQTISAFSKDCYDPSEKLAWWDKLRLNFHGSLEVIVTNGCDLNVHILGSYSPYYTFDSDYFGNDGVNIIFGKGVNVKVGNTGIKNEAIRICCGELKITIPRIGKEQYYESYYLDDTLTEIVNNEIILKMSGDVQVSILWTFDPVLDNYFTKKRTHDDIFLKLPQFATPYPNTTVFDSFCGFRTKSMHFNVTLSSPSYYFAGLNYQHNYAHLSLDAVNYIMNFSEFLSMGFLGLPVGIGPLFNKNIDKKPTMDISEFAMKINLMPLMIGLSSYINEEYNPNEFMIGIRLKAQTLNMEFSLVNEDNKGLDFNFSNAIITSIEGKIYTLGNANSEESQLYSFKGNEQKDKKLMDDDDNDIYSWRNDFDKFYIHNNIPINSKHFVWSSYVSYFKRNAIGDPEKLKKEYQSIENDISRVQVDLIQKRYFEIEILIRKLVEHQNNMELSTNKLEQSMDIVDLLAILYEKKKILKEQMEKEESSFYFNSEGSDSSNDLDTGLFNNIFIVHNIRIIWNEAVRNVIFKMVHLNNRINLLHTDMTYKIDKEMQRIATTKYTSNNIEQIIEKMVNSPSIMENNQHRDSTFNIIMNTANSTDELKLNEKLNIDNSSSVANELLNKLISEQNTHFVVTEQDNNNTEDEDVVLFPEIQTKSDTYICSRNEASPDYISPYEKTVNSLLINFINPEVCFEVGVDYNGKNKDLGLMLLVAKSAQYRSISITDLDVEDFNNVKEEEIIKTRMHVAIQDAQLNTAHRSKRNKFPLPLILNTSEGKLEWPLWVPLECIIDPTSHCGIMEHIADSFNGNWLSDTYNPSYVKPHERLQNKTTKKSNIIDGEEKDSDSPSHTVDDNTILDTDINNNTGTAGAGTTEKEDKKTTVNVNGTLKLNSKSKYIDNDNETDTNMIAIKECNLCATSLQYCTIYYVICDLFSYTEPNVLKMEDSVQKIVFRLEQLDDMSSILEKYYKLKENIRMLKESITQIEWKDLYYNEFEDLTTVDSRTKYKQLQNHLYQSQDDLLYLVMALKRINKIRGSTKRNNSSKVVSKFIYISKDLTYNMLLDNSVPFCECEVKDFKFQIDTLDDKTNSNTCELRKAVVHNLLEKDNVYMKALVPYLPHQREYMEQNSKEKMFRVYYRENPAIGGIPIIDHFEINLIPILVQITNKLVNHILWYIFPDKYKQHTANSLLDLYADVNPDELDYSNVDSIIFYSLQQHPGDTINSETKSKKKAKSGGNENEEVILSDNELNKNNGSGGNLSDDELKDWKYNENSDEDIIYDQPIANEGNVYGSIRSRKGGSTNALSTLPRENGANENKIENDVNQMQNRASQNRTFVYIKIPGAHHCISYKGPKNKNISDIFQFTFKFPTLEYRNKTWSWYDFLMAVKKDLTRTVINHVASLMKEKIFKRKLNEKESNKMFGMLDEQIMFKFKKYYKNKSGNSGNNANANISNSNNTNLNINGAEEEINFNPETNEDELDMAYVEELKKQLFDNENQDSDSNMNSRSENLSRETLNEMNTTKINKANLNLMNKKLKASTLTRDKSNDSLDSTTFPVPIREANSRALSNISNSKESINTVNSYSTIFNDYNEYMFIKKRMLFGKYMDDK